MSFSRDLSFLKNCVGQPFFFSLLRVARGSLQQGQPVCKSKQLSFFEVLSSIILDSLFPKTCFAQAPFMHLCQQLTRRDEFAKDVNSFAGCWKIVLC